MTTAVATDLLAPRALQTHAFELLARIVTRAEAGSELSGRVRTALESALADAGAVLPVTVTAVGEIEREPGHAAKAKLVVSEVAARA